LLVAVPGETKYPLHLHPAIDRKWFNSPDDIVMPQLDIRDVDDSFVRPWYYQRVLVEGAVVSANVSLVAWVINGVPVSSYPCLITTPIELMVYQICHLVVKSMKVWYRKNYEPPAPGDPPMLDEATQPILSSSPSTKAAKGPEGERIPANRKGKEVDKRGHKAANPGTQG
jgi:hypothetical protein